MVANLGIGTQMQTQTERIGDWFQTFTGRKFWPLDPRPEEMFIEDIAHSLSNMCRFNGHCRMFYSIAQHCVLGANELLTSSVSDAFHFLMHENPEAYICDLVSPIKHNSGLFGELYKQAEDNLERASAQRFYLDFPMPPIIKEIDYRMLHTEKRELLADPPAAWKTSEGLFNPFPWPINTWQPAYAEKQFMNLFFNLDREFKKLKGI